ncbi:helix-turn-helix transcriptional regulator [Alkalicoccobacillus murimartini]|uniref:ArsR family transcriptional regulator n=1 Tax=Alkalicoccobacillus murimartini TaxID=171685 RepID=A0ABT9YFI8_9BACI|nr:metalloregulator ArsR/SmtB family transcription factor [Alkalicoccobacillus murimartini]MDQ0206605.1 putative ArsR family transcriptional regulator [Alkalicoccobacillus murimartini]
MRDQTTSTRSTVLTLLKRWHELTTAELAAELNITEMAVRRHLRGLEEEQLITSRVVRQTMGRPVHKYYLTDLGSENFPRNYSHLSLGFLEDLRSMYGAETINQLFEKRHTRLHQSYKPMVTGDLSERVEALATIQNEQGYMVEWNEKEDGSFQFIEYNCPIAQVAKSYPIACTCEKRLFKELLGTDEVERDTCMAENGDAHCIYTIKKQTT